MSYSPFATFRRNQKMWLTGAVLLAMISFLFLGQIITLIGGRSGGQSGGLETYAECRTFGKITNRELHAFQTNRENLKRFFSVLYINLAQGADETKMQSLAPLRGLCGEYENRLDAERSVDAWLIVQYAQSEGLAPKWDDMRTFLSELTAGHLKENIFQKTLADTGLSRQQLEMLLAQHILEQQAMERSRVRYSAVSPATRWDWFQRLYRQVTIEVAALPVADFTGQTGEPSESQLKAFFEEYKSKKHDPGLADSGLISPAKIAFQYVVAEPNPKILDSVAEDEMKAYYEANKDTQFRKPVKPLTDLPGLPGAGSTPFPTPGKPIFNIPNPVPNTNPNPAEPPQTEDFPKIPETSSTGALIRQVKYQAEAKPEEPKTADVKKEEPKPEEVKPAESKPEDVKPAEAKPEETKPAEAKPEETTSTDVKPAEPADVKSTETKPEDVKPADVKPVDVKPVDAKPEDAKPAETKPAEEKPETPVDLSVLYYPFDEVKTAIRETLAREKASKGLPVIQDKMNEFAKVYNECFEQRKPLPPLPDLSATAAAHNLELKTVPLSDIYTAVHTEFARGLIERDRLIRLYRNIPVNFVPEIFPGTKGEVLLWVTDQQAEKKPEKLDDVRELAVRRWKEIEARPLAMKKAEELAARLNSSAGPSGSPSGGKLLLTDVLEKGKSANIAETEPFTWKTYGEGVHPITAIMYRQEPMLGEVREKGVAAGNGMIDNKVIFMPGSDFMEKVYSLRINEAGAVFNQPQNTVYVVRLIRSSPSEDSLRERFQTSFALEYLYAGQPDLIRAAYKAWLADIQAKTGFRWIKKPEQQYGD